MDFVVVADVLADRDLAGTMDPGLVALLAQLHERAVASDESQRGKFENFTVTVNPRGEIEVDTSAGEAFADWVWAAGDLALSIGPKQGFVKGEMRKVTEILGDEDDEDDEDGEDEDAAPAATALPPPPLTPSSNYHWTPWSVAAPTAPTVVVGDVFIVYRCTSCAAVSDLATDFGGSGAALQCDGCGGAVVTQRAVLAPGHLVLLRET